MKRRWIWIGGGTLLLGALLLRRRRQVVAAFSLVREAYSGVSAWAASRGRQIRDAFGLSSSGLAPAGSTQPAAMSTDEWNRRKLGELQPAFRGRFEQFLSAAQAVARQHGAEFIVWDAVRTLERQTDLYQQGRSRPGDIVTHVTARGNHLYGLAVDLVFKKDGRPAWDHNRAENRWYFTEVLPLARQHGLESLYVKSRIDPPHIEVPSRDKPAAVAVAMRQIQADFPGIA